MRSAVCWWSRAAQWHGVRVAVARLRPPSQARPIPTAGTSLMEVVAIASHGHGHGPQVTANRTLHCFSTPIPQHRVYAYRGSRLFVSIVAAAGRYSHASKDLPVASPGILSHMYRMDLLYYRHYFCLHSRLICIPDRLKGVLKHVSYERCLSCGRREFCIPLSVTKTSHNPRHIELHRCSLMHGPHHSHARPTFPLWLTTVPPP